LQLPFEIVSLSNFSFPSELWN